MRRARWLAAVSVAAMIWAATPAAVSARAPVSDLAPGPPAAVTDIRSGCRGPSDSVAIADDLLRNRYTFPAFPTVTLPSNPTWAEDPLHNNSWLYHYHSLTFVWSLTTAWVETGDHRYLDRALFLLNDWYRDNPRSAPRSPYSWNDHATARRAMVYACAFELMAPRTGMRSALAVHGRTLADPAFYRREGNHALNQDIGLLEAGCVFRRSDWTSLAADRINDLIGRSIDGQGATNEQAIYYELYNYERYRYAEQRLAECGQTVGGTFERVDLMPAFLAHATLPNGTYAPLGDTSARNAKVIPGTPAEFAATKGASGPKPGSTDALFKAGFAFARTGWGEARPFADETMLTARFGPARILHGHRDGGSITLYGYGSPLLVDSGGPYSYNSGPYRSYFVGRDAHNLVAVTGAKLTTAPVTDLRWQRESSSMFEIAVSSRPYVGVTADRRVTFSRAMGYVVVDDRMTATVTRTYRQLWHLRDGSAPVVQGARTWTRASRGNVLIVQLIVPSATRIVTGATSPVQGWITYRFGDKVAAPVVEASRSGTSARFLTLLVPYGTTQPTVSISDSRLTSSGYSMTLTVDGRAERLDMGAASSSITPLD